MNKIAVIIKIATMFGINKTLAVYVDSADYEVIVMTHQFLPSGPLHALHGNPYNCYTLYAKKKQATIPMQDDGLKPTIIFVGWSYRSVETDNLGCTSYAG